MASRKIFALGMMCAIMLASTTTTALTCDEFAANNGSTFTDASVQTIESSHPYCDSQTVTQNYSFTNSAVTAVNITFDSQSNIESYWDSLVITYTDSTGSPVTTSYSGTTFSDLTIAATAFSLTFASDMSNNYYGYKFTATPVQGNSCSSFTSNTGASFDNLEAQTIESPHNYCNYLSVSQHYSFTDASVAQLSLVFDPQSYIENSYDNLVISGTDSNGNSFSHNFTGGNFADLTIDAAEFDLTFNSDYSVNYYGFKITATPLSACSGFTDNSGATFDDLTAHTVQSAHPYCNNQSVTQHYSFSNSSVANIHLDFDAQSETEMYWDNLVITYTDSNGAASSTTYSGTSFDAMVIPASEFDLTFTSDFSNTYWGYSFTATPHTSAAAAKAAHKAAYHAAQKVPRKTAQKFVAKANPNAAVKTGKKHLTPADEAFIMKLIFSKKSA